MSKDKKREHDPDDRDRKRRKKEKKSKHSNSHKRKGSSTELSKPSDLAGALTWGMLTFPKLLDELPQMLAALDGGQLVNIDNLSNMSLKMYLDKLFVLLPLRYSSGDGWYKDKDSGIKSISGYVLNRMVQTGGIVQPSDLTAGQQSAATKASPVLLKVVERHPELASELPSLLEGIAQGQTVRLGGIQDPLVRAQVVALLQAVGVCHDGDSDDDGDNDGDGDGSDRAWTVPSSEQRGGIVRAALVSLVDAIAAAGVFAPLGPSPAQETSKPKHNDSSIDARSSGHDNGGVTGSEVRARSDSGSSSDDDGGDDDDDDGDGDSSSSNDDDKESDEARVGKESRRNQQGAPRVGPMRPSNAQLAAAAQLAARHPHPDEEDDEEDEVGPLPRAPSRVAVSASALYTGSASAVSLGGVSGVGAADGVFGLGDGGAVNTLGSGDVFSRRGKAIITNSSSSGSSSSSSSGASTRVRDTGGDVGDDLGGGVIVTEREEWMINPGEDRGIAGFETFGVSRKFNTGKLAKKVNEGLAAEREALERAMEGSEVAQRTKAVMEEYRERRGASLMDRHAADRAAATARKSGGGEKGAERRAFDREVDVLGRRTVGQQQVQQLVEHAKELDSRFDKGSVQRSFL